MLLPFLIFVAVSVTIIGGYFAARRRKPAGSELPRQVPPPAGEAGTGSQPPARDAGGRNEPLGV